MSLEKLRAELVNDPAGIGYASMTDSQVVDSLRTKNRPRFKALSSAELLAWAAADGRLVKIDEAAVNSQVPSALRSIAIAASLLVRRDGTTLDLNLEDRVALVEGLVAGGVLNEADKSALYALAGVTASRLEELGLGEFHLGDVQWARQSGPWAGGEA